MRYSKIQYICWLFSGAEISLLKECPTDFNRQASIGFTIFMTCLLAGLSGGFAAWRFTIDTPGQDGNWIASIIFGLVWGMLVFSIDRSMVVTLKKDPTLKSQPFLIPLVTRMILAGLLAFMISIPLETKIFEPEIAKQAMDDIQNAKLKYGNSVVATSGIGSVESRKKDAADLARIASEQISLEDSKIPGVPGLLAEAAGQDVIANRKDSEAQMQIKAVARARAQTYVPASYDPVTGVRKGDYFSSKGPAARRYREAKGELNNLKSLANAAHSKAAQLRADARTKANEFRTSADKNRSQAVSNSEFAEAERKKKQAKIDSSAAAYETQVQKRGFVSEFVSMENAANQKGNGSMLFFLWFIRILFFVIEILPTIVKLATPVGEYDHQLYAHEQMFALALRTNYKILEDREVVRQQTELNITNQLEQARQDKEIELGQKMLEQTANIQNSLAKQMLNDWHKVEKEKHRLATSPPASVAVMPAQSPIHSPTSTSASSPSHLSPSPITILQPSQTLNSAVVIDESVNKHVVMPPPLADSVTAPTHTNGNPHITSAALTKAGMWRFSHGSRYGLYVFENGSLTNNRVRRKLGSEPLEDGLWEYPQGDESRLRISFGTDEQEYNIQRLTNTEMRLKNARTDEELIFQA